MYVTIQGPQIAVELVQDLINTTLRINNGNSLSCLNSLATALHMDEHLWRGWGQAGEGRVGGLHGQHGADPGLGLRLLLLYVPLARVEPGMLQRTLQVRTERRVSSRLTLVTLHTKNKNTTVPIMLASVYV